MQIEWTNEAKEQLDTIYSMYEDINLTAAVNIRQSIILSVRKLVEFPHMAAIEPLLKRRKIKYRSLVVERLFKVIYSIDKNTIYISAVWDCRQNPKKLKNKVKGKP
ncbi:type II toxin-antitoxin system RelE/ParE family toxin [Dysgonomonas sp. 521]|uniref:type II toxin-antitoxin system RelE/ParE family toxin n=1 Tax=Dysgonomonas sp. 521 TaxID=2302932 RepID=UPI0013D75D99|nr:type II toxin-antitoxin system RelE/ParE family toxin [Dysgonomonas sp. 521]NDV96570.1 type II toxin-antitoxin system RelE/ParE family toxin [Dysgonomonas sp. 521]